jgi:hypothetical protein
MISLEQITLFQKFIKEMGIIFTTPYFQILAGQEVKEIKKETITIEELNLINNNKSKYNSERNMLFLARDNKGKLQGTIYINNLGDITKKLFYS